jgi:hypothetical protein
LLPASKDFLAPSIEKGMAEYKMKGFFVDSIVHPDAEHCLHEITDSTLAFWSKYL